MHKESFMRTTIDLPDELVKEAMRVSNQRTKTGVIVSALEEYVRKSKIQSIKKYRGRVDISIDLDKLRKRT